jgi:hypothetical protein
MVDDSAKIHDDSENYQCSARDDGVRRRTGGGVSLGCAELAEEEAEAADSEADTHETEAGANPSEKGALGGEVDAGVALGGHGDDASSS